MSAPTMTICDQADHLDRKLEQLFDHPNELEVLRLFGSMPDAKARTRRMDTHLRQHMPGNRGIVRRLASQNIARAVLIEMDLAALPANLAHLCLDNSELLLFIYQGARDKGEAVLAAPRAHKLPTWAINLLLAGWLTTCASIDVPPEVVEQVIENEQEREDVRRVIVKLLAEAIGPECSAATLWSRYRATRWQQLIEGRPARLSHGQAPAAPGRHGYQLVLW